MMEASQGRERKSRFDIQPTQPPPPPMPPSIPRPPSAPSSSSSAPTQQQLNALSAEAFLSQIQQHIATPIKDEYGTGALTLSSIVPYFSYSSSLPSKLFTPPVLSATL